MVSDPVIHLVEPISRSSALSLLLKLMPVLTPGADELVQAASDYEVRRQATFSLGLTLLV